MISIWIAVGVLSILTIFNLAASVYFIRGFAEKLALLSHVAVQYLNESEVREAEKKLDAPKIAKVVNKEFVSRRRR